jgi:signal transduction histidine kinase
LLPLILVSLASLLAHALVYARIATRQTQDRIDTQLQGFARVLSESNFPLTPAVLGQMRLLSGAEFVVSDFDGRVGLSTLDVEGATISTSGRVARFDQVTVSRPLELAGEHYHYASVELSTRPSRPQALVLHILFPREDYLAAWRSAFYPPLWVGVATVAAIALVVLLFASRISRAARKLGGEIERLAGGDFSPLEPPALDDELRDLAINVNQTASRLADYEQQIRHTEQLRTLGLIGAGLAHEMRNAATGCRLAVDLHGATCPAASEDESLDVARRQLHLMETRLQRFLSLGKSSATPQHQLFDLGELVETLLPLVSPMAKHAHVQLEWNPSGIPCQVTGDPDGIGQGILNVVINALEAARQTAAINGQSPVVTLAILHDAATQEAVIEVADTGPGPSEALRSALFEPFATDRPEGVGLGLAVAKEAMVAHGGSIEWRRENDRTIFSLRLPASPTGTPNGSLADRR